MVAEIERRTRGWQEVADDAALSGEDVLDFVVGMIESGKPLSALAVEVGEATGSEIPRAKLMRYLESLGEGASERLTRARARGAHGLAEDAILLADQPVLDSADASRQRLRVGARQWTAERWNRAELGNVPGPQVSISVVNLHLASLQAAGPRIQAAEVLAIEPATSAEDMGVLGL